MSDLDLGLFELELGLLQLSLYQHASIRTNAGAGGGTNRFGRTRA